MNRTRYIVIEGPIGVGKSTLTNILAKRFHARSVFEIVEENPFLPMFYRDRSRYAFPTQMFFLLSRFKQQQDLYQQDLFAQVTVSDYLFAKDQIFASLTLNESELALYHRVFAELSPRVMRPDLVIYLQAPLDVLLKRIRNRGREFERAFDADYLESLCKTYQHFFATYTESPLLVVDTTDIDVVSRPEDVDRLLAEVEAHTSGVQYYPREAGQFAGSQPAA